MSDDDNDEVMAAEYVLGTLEADERTVFASVLTHDPAERELVARWEARLARLGAVVPEVVPPPEVWDRLSETLFGAPSAPPLTLMEGGRRDDDTERLRRSRNLWRGFALASGALAASLAILVTEREIVRRWAEQPAYVAVVNRGGDAPALIVRVDLARGQVFVRPVSTEVPAGKSLELWYIGAGKAPKSMGLIDGGPLRLPLPEGAKVDKASFAVTVEPEGGSPTGGPTGPIVYSGQLIKE
jgi:anti-sigma-K factor RskA